LELKATARDRLHVGFGSRQLRVDAREIELGRKPAAFAHDNQIVSAMPQIQIALEYAQLLIGRAQREVGLRNVALEREQNGLIGGLCGLSTRIGRPARRYAPCPRGLFHK
jgi:hypothetical protein